MTVEDVFVGTSSFYAAYRPAYPTELLDFLIGRLPHGGRLVDLGAGTGELAIPLSPYVGEVWAVDPSAEMVEWGRRKAKAAGRDNITWVIQTAEDLTVPEASVDLVTIGAAFHWMDKRLVGGDVYHWLRPGRTLAVTGPNSTWAGTEPWQQLTIGVIRRWLGEKRRAGTGAFRVQERHEEAMAGIGFQDVQELEFPVELRWTLDDFVGYLYSSSYASHKVLGDRRHAFESDLRRTLLDHDPSGIYTETLRFSCIVGTRP
jgi:SAM-dependent methyltransferase